MRTTKNHAKRGFTLIELLVVIMIIGVLATIVLTSLQAARNRALDTSRLEAVKTLRGALETYYTDNGGFPTSNGTGTGEVFMSDATLQNKLSPYSGIAKQLITDNDKYYGGGTTGVTQTYEMLINLSSSKQCKTGVNVTTSRWGASIADCGV